LALEKRKRERERERERAILSLLQLSEGQSNPIRVKAQSVTRVRFKAQKINRIRAQSDVGGPLRRWLN
jgi:hypothetical protein